MEQNIDIAELIKKGGIYYNVPGNNVNEVFQNICGKLNLPEGITAEQFCSELQKREQMMSTAVGNGIAIPHPRPLMLKAEESQQIILCFTEKPLDMNAPDGRNVSSLFILLTSNTNSHLSILKKLAELFQKVNIRTLLEEKSSAEKILEAMKTNQ